MRPISESSILNLAMFIVAFGVVALVVIFAHPASQPMATAVNGAVGDGATAASASFKPAVAEPLRRRAAE